MTGQQPGPRIVPAEEAREMVEAATPGPWSRYGTWPYEVFQEPTVDSEDSAYITTAVLREVDSELIAAAPDLAHTAAVLGEQLAAALPLHQPETYTFLDGRVLVRCWCCNNPKTAMPEVWPCPTARALGVTDGQEQERE